MGFEDKWDNLSSGLNLLNFVALHESGYGPKRTFGAYILESAFGGKADIASWSRHVRF
jgi:hypothetical protein